MDQSPDSFIVKLPTVTIDKYLILKSIWSADQIILKLVDLRNSSNCNEWTGNITVADLKDSALDLEIAYDDFYTETKRALTTNHGLQHFEYELTPSGEFILRKVDGCRMLYCETALTRKSGLLHKLLLESIDTIATARTELTTKQLDIQKLDMEFKMLAQSYEKSTHEKCTNETEIMKKCANLVNAKKRKIAELQELLEEGKRFREEAMRSKSPGVDSGRDDVEQQQLTQPMPVPDTQRIVRALPKRKNLLAAEVMEKQQPVERGAADAGRTRGRLEPCEGSSSSERAMNSEEMFDAMMR